MILRDVSLGEAIWKRRRMYFPSRWFMEVKQRRKDWWLSYL
jgi:hypothetical protein